MVQGFLGDESKNAALYTGVMISSFSLAEALTGMYWGSLSDRVGRKPVLLLGCFGTMISLVVTGFAQSFWVALLARLFGGALNGNIGIIQTMVGELVRNPEHERKLSLVSFNSN
jgi:MFS family permease